MFAYCHTQVFSRILPTAYHMLMYPMMSTRPFQKDQDLKLQDQDQDQEQSYAYTVSGKKGSPGIALVI